MKTAQIIQQAPIKSNISNPYLSRLRDASVRGHNRGGPMRFPSELIWTKEGVLINSLVLESTENLVAPLLTPKWINHIQYPCHFPDEQLHKCMVLQVIFWSDQKGVEACKTKGRTGPHWLINHHCCLGSTGRHARQWRCRLSRLTFCHKENWRRNSYIHAKGDMNHVEEEKPSDFMSALVPHCTV